MLLGWNRWFGGLHDLWSCSSFHISIVFPVMLVPQVVDIGTCVHVLLPYWYLLPVFIQCPCCACCSPFSIYLSIHQPLGFWRLIFPDSFSLIIGGNMLTSKAIICHPHLWNAIAPPVVSMISDHNWAPFWCDFLLFVYSHGISLFFWMPSHCNHRQKASMFLSIYYFLLTW